MCRRIYIFLEIINIVLCLHYLWGKKVKIDFGTVLVICTDILIFEFIDQYKVNMIGSILIYFLIFVYTVSEFGKKMYMAVLSNILYILILGVMQLLITLPPLILHINTLSDDVAGIYVNIGVMFILFLLKEKISHLFDSIIEKKKISVIAIVLFGAVVISSIFRYKLFLKIAVDEFLVVIIFGGLICILVYCWQIEREKVYVKQIELHMHNCYDESFRELVRAMQEKQHDFHNHIQAIQSMHFSVHTYDELVAKQDMYCNTLIDDNKFFGLLNGKNPVLTGFLYGRFLEADEMGVKIDYSIKIGQSIIGIPEYILIEITGILLDNAIEAVAEYEHKAIEFQLGQEEDILHLEVGNPIRDVDYMEVSKFFKSGYSNKKEHSGIGLHKVLRYSEKYGFNVIVEKEEKDKQEWLFFKLSFESRSC